MAATSIPHGARFFVETGDRWLPMRLRSFIAEVADQTRRTGRFGPSVLAALAKDPALEQFFDIDPGCLEETFGLRERYLFPAENSALETLRFQREFRGDFARFGLSASSLSDLGRVLQACGRGVLSRAAIRKSLEEPARGLFDALLASGVVEERRREPLGFAESRTPAIYRLQHASILFRTATTGLLIDPHLHSPYERHGLERNVLRADLEGKVDAVAISHSHGDHYSLSTLAMFPRDTPIIVPKVPRRSILCEDMKQRLKSLGFKRVLTPEWYGKPVVIGDIEVFALPFYGEQPLSTGSKHPDLRNWGNTYFVRTSRYTAWALIDSGDDDKGRTADVAARVRKTFGGVDFLLSNLRPFTPFSPTYITGRGDYWLSLPTAYMRKFHELGRMLLTLGPEGVAQACRLAGARHYLPYAHLFASLGALGEREPELLGKLQQSMKRIGCPTRIVPWTIGEGCTLDAKGRSLRIAPPL